MQEITKIIVVTYSIEHNIIRQESQVKDFDSDFVWKISILGIFDPYFAKTWPKLKLIKFKFSKKATKNLQILLVDFKFTK